MKISEDKCLPLFVCWKEAGSRGEGEEEFHEMLLWEVSRGEVAVQVSGAAPPPVG